MSGCLRAIAVCTGLAWLAGCAAPSATIRTLPPENPAAENAAAAESAAAFAAAATASAGEGSAAAVSQPPSRTSQAADQPPQSQADEPGNDAAVVPAPPVRPEDAPSMATYDPWERFNRMTYRFNARFDEAVFLPVANLYRRVPTPVRSGVHHFFGNLSELDSIVNYVLQARFKLGWRSLERFAINSTVGLGGLIDVATRLKLPGAPTGWGNTLARWGVHPGPYWVMPLLGPSTLRDGFGFFADYGTSYAIDIAHLYRGDASWGLALLNSVDQRSNISFRYYASGSPFEYENIRFLYVRKTLIEDDALRTRSGAQSSPTRHNPDDPAGK